MSSETSHWDQLLEWLKRQQRWYYGAEYRNLELTESWMRRPGDARYQEEVVPALVPRPLNSILIFKPDEIGDAVCALPALAELRRELPQARLTLVCLKEAAPIYQRSGLLDEIVAFDLRLRWRRFRSLDSAAARRQGRARETDLAIFLKTYPPLFGEFSKWPSRFKVHPRDPRLRSPSPYQPRVSLWGQRRVHQSLQLLEIVSAVTGKSYALSDIRFPEMQWTQDDRRALSLVFGTHPPERFLIVHPFAKFETRRYPIEYWHGLLAGLHRELKVPLVVIGGPADPILSCDIPLHQAQGKLTLAQTGFLISRSAGLVGNLSGPAHWGASLGVPTVTLMSGHSAPTEWAPVGRSFVLRADVPCAPCHLWTCPVNGLACLKELTPERILPRIVKFFEGAPRPI